MARTTINIEPAIFKKIKELALKMGTTQTQLITLFLNLGISGVEDSSYKTPSQNNIKFTTFGQKGGLGEKVDLSDRKAVWAVFDQENPKNYGE